MADISTLFTPPSAPAAADRRIINRMSKVWTDCAAGKFPSWEEIRANDLGEDWNWVFVVDLAQSVGYPHFIFLGAKLAKLSEVYLQGGGEWAVSLLDRASEDINAAVAKSGPHMIEDEITLRDGQELMFRCMTAPLADDGRFVTHVFGVVSGRISADDEIFLNPVNDA